MRYFRPTRESFIPKGFTAKVADKKSDAVAYLWESKRNPGKPGATIFVGKQAKPIANFWYRDVGRRQAAIEIAFEGRRARLGRLKDSAEKRKAFVHPYKAGDMFRTSWGYDQTNVEFFEVTEVAGKYVILREIAAERTESGPVGSWQGQCTPLKGAFLKPRYDGDDQGVPIRRLAQDGHIKIDDVRTAWPVETRDVAGVKVARTYSWSEGH